jgi:hypothetical protein
MSRKPGMLEKLARRVWDDSTVRNLTAAVKGGDRVARRVIEDRITELGVTVRAGYMGFFIAHLCSKV